MLYKNIIIAGVRQFHTTFLGRPLPNKLGIYLHELRKDQYPAFTELVQYFKDNQYTFVNARQYLESPSDARSVFLSFDDNFSDWHKALTLLDDCRISATFFTNTLPLRGDCPQFEIDAYYDRIGYFGDRSCLSKTEIREIYLSGHKIGCHSHSHFDLAKVPPQRRNEEIVESKNVLEDIIGDTVGDFSYPFGMARHFSSELKKYCYANGFYTISTAIPGLQYAPIGTPYINRSSWLLSRSLEYNLKLLSVDGRVFVKITGRSPVG